MTANLTTDDLMTVSEISPDVLRLIASRIEASNTLEQIIYRETELDEVWRLADIALAEARRRGNADGAELQRLTAIAEMVHAAHDMIGDNEDTIASAAVLRKAADLVG